MRERVEDDVNFRMRRQILEPGTCLHELNPRRVDARCHQPLQEVIARCGVLHLCRLQSQARTGYPQQHTCPESEHAVMELCEPLERAERDVSNQERGGTAYLGHSPSRRRRKAQPCIGQVPD